jgi:flavin reductase (DIM6/NTAB) family NADH-FMN oxidoreductase RutF
VTAAPANDEPGADLLRRFFRRYSASAAVVTAMGERPVGFTATSLTSVSLHPPMLSIAVAPESSCWPTLSAATHFGVHLLAADQEPIAERFARRGIDRFAAPTRWRAGPFEVPLLHGVLAWTVCRVAAQVPAGDHIIVLGEPLAVDHREGDPLVHHDGSYWALDS